MAKSSKKKKKKKTVARENQLQFSLRVTYVMPDVTDDQKGLEMYFSQLYTIFKLKVLEAVSLHFFFFLS